MDISIPRDGVTMPTETSPLLPRRDPGSTSHLWRFARQGQQQGQTLGNSVAQLQRGVNRALQAPAGVTSGFFPFKIYQLPAQLRKNPQPNDYLKVRCRNGLVQGRAYAVPTGFTTAYNPILPFITECVYANAPDPTQMGVPTSYNASVFFTLPYADDSEVFLANGGDPDYLMIGPDSGALFCGAYFWIDMNDETTYTFGNVIGPMIHFGGIWFDLSGVNHDFGDTIPNAPWNLFGWTPPATYGNIIVIGTVSMAFSDPFNPSYSLFQNLNQLYVTNFIRGHQISTPNNYINFVGDYSDTVFYWTGDLVNGYSSDSASPGDIYVNKWIQCYTYIDSSGLLLGDIRTVQSLGIGMEPPPDPPSLTGNDFWAPFSYAVVPP